MPRRARTHPQQDQFCLALDDPRNRPPAAPSTPAILEALAELLLSAAQKTEGWENDAREDRASCISRNRWEGRKSLM